MPRTTISQQGFYGLTEHDSEAAWVSFVSIGLHPRENEQTKIGMAQIAQDDGRLYVCSNNVKTVAPESGLNQNATRLHEPFPFYVTLANSDIRREQTVQLSFDNIDRILTDVLRGADYPLSLHYSLGMVLRVEFDASGRNGTAYAEGLELYVTDLELVNVSWNATTITGTLTKDNVLDKAFPSNHPYYQYDNFPGLYGTEDL